MYLADQMLFGNVYMQRPPVLHYQLFLMYTVIKKYAEIF
jgi:hypothetical protein